MKRQITPETLRKVNAIHEVMLERVKDEIKTLVDGTSDTLVLEKVRELLTSYSGETLESVLRLRDPR